MEDLARLDETVMDKLLDECSERPGHQEKEESGLSGTGGAPTAVSFWE